MLLLKDKVVEWLNFIRIFNQIGTLRDKFLKLMVFLSSRILLVKIVSLQRNLELVVVRGWLAEMLMQIIPVDTCGINIFYNHER